MPKTMNTIKTELCSAKKWAIISMNDMMLLLLMLLIMFMIVVVDIVIAVDL
jgi:hypothetical protein